MILVDSCILIDVLEDDQEWADWSQQQLEGWSVRGPLLINPVIYAELAAYAFSKEALDAEVAQAGLHLREFSSEALFLAGRAHAAYRRRGGLRAGVLSDFLTGAQAAVLEIPILTRDTARFRSYFATVKLVCPGII